MSRKYEVLVPAVATPDGHGVPHSPLYGDVYHARAGALAQARHVFLGGNGLPGRWRGAPSFTVCETGFGLGNNFLALWLAWRSDPQRCERLHVLSFEAHPFTREALRQWLAAPLEGEARALADQLLQAWPPLLPGLHRLEFEDGAVTLTLAFGSVSRMAKEVDARVDAFFLDGFAPRRNPEMWTRSLFGQMMRLANQDATAATWCSAGQVRRDLAAAGFLVSKLPGFGGKRDMVAATVRSEMRRPPGAQAYSSRPSRQPVLVVGGGLAGAGVAQALALRGHAVTVLDPIFREGLGASHCGHLAAALTPVATRDDDIRSRLSRAGAERALQRWQGLNDAARPLVCGTLTPARCEAEARTGRQALAELAFPSDWVRWMEAAEASRKAGCSLPYGGMWFAQGQRVLPEPLLNALFMFPGVTCHAKHVAGLRRGDGETWEALDSRGEVVARASQVVLANARHAAALLASVPGLAVPAKVAEMASIAGQVSYLRARALPDARAIVAGEGYLLPALDYCVDETGAGRFTDEAALMVAGSTYDKLTGEARVTARGHQEILGKLADLLGHASAAGVGGTTTAIAGYPDADVWRADAVVGGWAGWRAAVRDRLPVIGPMDGASGLWLACGYGSRGLTWSALAGDIIAAALNREPMPLERSLLTRIRPR
ncbi:FAD-dependent oxidoreductase [Allopusillimonas soli]|uniref:tRNA 5-methylaminomethyl-2-thiouridine biosynthesis bifunctional protein MnmC n=1 Tax=Allopusillimonas soli TaxID=659016 RepID=A0A853FJ53_9BURK|nr:tRNA (5-methylaminomethyl-2-thiouridine)(34)-methyltransferase MnmD [Allopusillimonas soli]NYT38770.1 tRNA (5-methylaminomethyl-2-thiouridine)(34)-methyltransferase MnmD [Allopusillimonas soli]TEA70248.1 FAD-dependent oxidoreductase [Allopusillimonas soli]